MPEVANAVVVAVASPPNDPCASLNPTRRAAVELDIGAVAGAPPLAAKGQQWKSVHVLNGVDGGIPSDMNTGNSDDIEEARRLLYVAMTRAKQYRHLVVPNRCFIKQQAHLGERHVYAARSRFISRPCCSV